MVKSGSEPSPPGPASPGSAARPSPNIWGSPETYELENRSLDPDGRLWHALRRIGDWQGRVVADVGCGSGFYLPLFARNAAQVIGIEPHRDLAALASRRTRRLPNVRVLEGLAQDMPLPDASIDVIQARWAYFFGPGCEPGLAEVARVLRPGAVAMVVDNDPSRSTFGGWFRLGYPERGAAEQEDFWNGLGWRRERIDMGWRFETRDDLEQVVRIEFAPAVADRILADHEGLEVDYAVNLWWWRRPS
jgi:SAM-dependent methyltransferase